MLHESHVKEGGHANPVQYAADRWRPPSRRDEPGFEAPTADWSADAKAHFESLDALYEARKDTLEEPGAPNGRFHGACPRGCLARDGHGHCWCCGTTTYDGSPAPCGCPQKGDIHGEGRCKACLAKVTDGNV